MGMVLAFFRRFVQDMTYGAALYNKPSMKYIYILFTVLILMPSISFAQTTTLTESQRQNILQEIQALQAELQNYITMQNTIVSLTNDMNVALKDMNYQRNRSDISDCVDQEATSARPVNQAMFNACSALEVQADNAFDADKARATSDEGKILSLETDS